MIAFRSFFAAALAASLMALAACGGGGSDAPGAAAPRVVQVDAARTARATLGPAGGSLSATAADGRVYTLTVPAGALAAETEISATPVTSMGDAPLSAGLKGAVRFGPSGLKFGLPATLRIEGASATAAAGKRLVGFLRSDDGSTMNLVPVAVAGGVLELPVLHFSDGGVAEASDPEIAAIPLAPIVDPAQELGEAVMREIRVDSSEDDEIAVLNRAHDQRLLPLLDQAATLADDVAQDAFRESVVNTWAIWQRLVDISGYEPARFGDRVAQARARAGGLLLGQVDRGRAACLAPPPLGFTQLNGLRRALWAQKVAQTSRLDGADLGLDAATVARRLNDCARVAFVPKAPPTLEVGRQASLDVQVELIFAADANAGPPVDFEFTVASTEAAIANPRGFSDLFGNYTTVVTPRAAGAVFDVRACLITFMANGAPVDSVMCGRQTVGGGSGDPAIDAFGLAGGASRQSGNPSERREDTVSVVMQGRALLGSADVQAVAASGTFSITQTRQERCGADQGQSVDVATTISGTITAASLVLPAGPGQTGAFSVSGLGRTSAQSVNPQTCAVSTVTDPTERSVSGPVFGVLRAERDAQGRLLSVVLGDATGTQGTLSRQ